MAGIVERAVPGGGSELDHEAPVMTTSQTGSTWREATNVPTSKAIPFDMLSGSAPTLSPRA